MEQDADKRRERHAWLYRKVEQQKIQLSLTDANVASKLKDAEHGMHMPIEGWHYTPKNALMYYPEPTEPTAADKVANAPKVRRASLSISQSPLATSRRR